MTEFGMGAPMADVVLGAVMKACASALTTAMEVESGGLRSRDFHVLDKDGLSLGMLRVHEGSVQLLMPSQWPERKMNERREVWRHWHPDKEPVSALTEWVQELIADAKKAKASAKEAK